MKTAHREAQKKYGSRAVVAAVLVGGGLILAGHPSLGKGLIAGALFSTLNFVLIAESLPYKLGKSRPRAALVSMAWILLRFGLMAVPLVLALKFHLFNPLTAALGLFSVPLAILWDHCILAFASSPGEEA
ncbi:MAG: ATP synthase subunit I [Desulfobacterales bacterium]|nr:ATP synthase subunit I [Desulfobacterales bacterium]